MVYFDTSFRAPLLLEEATSEAVERFIAGLPVGTLAVSHWTRVEFASLLAPEVRTGGLDHPTARDGCGVRGDRRGVLPRPAAQRAGLQLGQAVSRASRQRAGDALHLAIAQNNGAEAIYSFDKTLLRAGPALGLPVKIGIGAG